ncbi:class I SAM-dependent methyltransferase [Haloglomus litoreum]|uniref:class I SAM-dependent methyltransferase n=1 Tax=Haloglomus litoreum TaxID=3034026 RepID=UPI0023E88F73|nr:class I SAM-dependent methyltransferase [Haloglomus sp. DT116]
MSPPPADRESDRDDDRNRGTAAGSTLDEAVARTRETYERIADDYRERNAAVDPVEPLLERFRDVLPTDGAPGDPGGTAEGPRVLDAGCGHGRDAAWLAARGCRVVGLDFAAAQLGHAREVAPAAALVRGDLRRLPLAPGTFDGALAMASLLHLPREDLPDALDGLRRVLRPGGVLCVSVQRRLGDGSEGSDAPPTEAYGREGRYFVTHGPDALRARVDDAGLSVIEVDPDERWVWALARRPR